MNQYLIKGKLYDPIIFGEEMMIGLEMMKILTCGDCVWSK